jgi:formylglycine-generating enzyme
MVVGLGMWTLLGCAPPTIVARDPPYPPVDSTGCAEGMVAVAGGSFTMGHSKAAATVASFCMDRSEVTVDLYMTCVKAGACSAEHINSYSADGRAFSDEYRCNASRPGQGNHPMNCVAWEQAVAFCEAQGNRLPTEEEWEWAARGGARGTTYPWGNHEEWNQRDRRFCGLDVPNLDGTCAVGSFPSGDSPHGIHDLAGNVWEWTATNYDTRDRVIRGGSWMLRGLWFVSATFRYGYAPVVRASDLGFRCVRSRP